MPTVFAVPGLSNVLKAGAVLLLAASAGCFVKSIPVPQITVKATPEKLDRGRYLAEHVTGCIDCHSERDWGRYSGPMKPGTAGKGGEVFDEKYGLPGTIVASNITPAALKDWSDGEIVRAIANGISRDGSALFPLMPYPSYSVMDPDDLEAIVAYLRTLPPNDNKPPRTDLNFPVNFIVNRMPVESAPQKRPKSSDGVAYGKYMVTIGGCGDCHTPRKGADAVEGMFLAGGTEMPLPGGGIIRPTNITPDADTGIGAWSKKDFIAAFKNHASGPSKPVEPGKENTVMPWTFYAGMTDEDLGAMYEYLKTVPAVKNKFDVFTPPQGAGK
ncbi:MAG: cytochrome c [Deltaproteobacteria bacterium]|nr:cytochrome c [Deltaproteobacteria bacterium]